MKRINPLKALKQGLLISFLIIYSASILYPLFLMFTTSLKSTREIFSNPFGIPKIPDFTSYAKLITHSNYAVYFRNSLVVVLVSILFVLLLSSLVSYILAKYDFRIRPLPVLCRELSPQE